MTKVVFPAGGLAMHPSFPSLDDATSVGLVCRRSPSSRRRGSRSDSGRIAGGDL